MSKRLQNFDPDPCSGVTARSPRRLGGFVPAGTGRATSGPRQLAGRCRVGSCFRSMVDALHGEVTPQRRERWADGHRSPQPQCRSLFQGRAQGRAGGSEPAVADILRRSPGVGAPGLYGRLVSPVGDGLHRLCLPLGSGEIYHRPVGSEGPSGRGGRTGWDGRPSAAAIWRGGDGAVPSTIRWCDGGGDGGVVLLGDFEGRKTDEKAPFFIETRHVTAQMIPGSGDRDSSRRRAKTCAGTSLRRIILR